MSKNSEIVFCSLKTLLSQLESDLRLQKNAAATAKKFQSEMAKAKNELQKYKSSAGMVPNLQKQLAEKKKKLEILGSHDSGSGDKTNSEYEMLLSEQDAKIAEYLSGLSRMYFFPI